MYNDLLKQSRTLENVGAWMGSDSSLAVPGGPPERVLIGMATPTLLPTLGVSPVLGRNFLPDAGNERMALIDWATPLATALQRRARRHRQDRAARHPRLSDHRRPAARLPPGRPTVRRLDAAVGRGR